MSHFEHETMKLVNIETDTTLKLMLTPSFTLGLLAHAPFVSQHGSTLPHNDDDDDDGSTLPHNDDRRKMAPMVMIGVLGIKIQQLLNKYI